MTANVSLGQDQFSNRVGLYSDWFLSNSTFNDDVGGKTSDSFTNKKSKFHSEGWANWIKFIEIENILKFEESSSTQSYWIKSKYKSDHMNWLSYESLSYQVWEKDLIYHCPLQISKFRLVCSFNKHSHLKHDPHCVFWSGSKHQQGWTILWLVLSLRGQAQLSMIMSVAKQVVCLPKRKAIFILRDEQIELSI